MQTFSLMIIPIIRQQEEVGKCQLFSRIIRENVFGYGRPLNEHDIQVDVESIIWKSAIEWKTGTTPQLGDRRLGHGTIQEMCITCSNQSLNDCLEPEDIQDLENDFFDNESE